jgi:hypothetical protein
MTRSVRASQAERKRVLPGDGLIRDAIGTLTNAITINRSPRDVWPWLVQMGAGDRAGWYSYDRVDNGGRKSADNIVPALQDIQVGTLFAALPGESEGFHVLQFEPEYFLLLGVIPRPQSAPLVTWAFVLDEVGPHCTRLVVRVRAGRDYRFKGLLPALGLPLVRVIHFVMQRKQLLSIATRAETRPPVRDRDGKAA